MESLGGEADMLAPEPGMEDPGMAPDPGMDPGMSPDPAMAPMGPEEEEYAAGGRYAADGSAGNGGLKPTEDSTVSDKELMKFAKGQGAPVVQRFARITTENRRLKANYRKAESDRKHLSARLAVIETDKRYSERYSLLQQLEREGFDFDIDTEYERIKNMPEVRAHDHVEIITTNYSRIPTADVVPRLFSPQGSARNAAGTNKYEKKIRAAVGAEHAKAQKAGESITYDEARKRAEAGSAPVAHVG
jgi:hypothetical protein